MVRGIAVDDAEEAVERLRAEIRRAEAELAAGRTGAARRLLREESATTQPQLAPLRERLAEHEAISVYRARGLRPDHDEFGGIVAAAEDILAEDPRSSAAARLTPSPPVGIWKPGEIGPLAAKMLARFDPARPSLAHWDALLGTTEGALVDACLDYALRFWERIFRAGYRAVGLDDGLYDHVFYSEGGAQPLHLAAGGSRRALCGAQHSLERVPRPQAAARFRQLHASWRRRHRKLRGYRPHELRRFFEDDERLQETAARFFERELSYRLAASALTVAEALGRVPEGFPEKTGLCEVLTDAGIAYLASIYAKRWQSLALERALDGIFRGRAPGIGKDTGRLRLTSASPREWHAAGLRPQPSRRR